MRKQKVLYSIQDKYETTKASIKGAKQQLGKYKKHKKQQFENKKR